jgi:hypothetical protein
MQEVETKVASTKYELGTVKRRSIDAITIATLMASPYRPANVAGMQESG